MPVPLGGVSWFWRLTFAPSLCRSCYLVFLKFFQAVRGMYGSFFVKTAQTIRAVLFAMATVAKRAGLRSKSEVSHLFARSGWDFVCLTSEVIPTTSNWRKYWSPILVIRPNRSFPPLDRFVGVKPSQAANSRPFWN